MTNIDKAAAFFYENAGYSYTAGSDEAGIESARWKGARELARAEAYAEEAGWEYGVEQDPEGCIGCDCGEDSCDCYAGRYHECLDVILYGSGGLVLTALGSVCDPSPEYLRVIKAELALEAVPDNKPVIPTDAGLLLGGDDEWVQELLST